MRAILHAAPETAVALLGIVYPNLDAVPHMRAFTQFLTVKEGLKRITQDEVCFAPVLCATTGVRLDLASSFVAACAPAMYLCNLGDCCMQWGALTRKFFDDTNLPNVTAPVCRSPVHCAIGCAVESAAVLL